MAKILNTLSLVFLFIPAISIAQEFQYIPDAEFDPSIPTVEQVLGHKSGDEITAHWEMLRYFQALENAAPDRFKIFSYGMTWENRQLMYVAVSNAENIGNLQSLSDNMKKLADPRVTSEADAETIIADTVGTTWLSHGVHGNEISRKSVV